MREEIIRMAREVFGKSAILPFIELERFAALVAAAERERCAKVCEDLRKTAVMSKYATYSECMQIRNTHSDCAAAIRAL